ncbi:hereditary hemochromatosis protein homolog [Garra rufa]|uniref:hereditary hemochromatosis protein homolog n=1 Tax=Garra rufa TaxID=137080 RepID=UPI003CCE8F9B
MERIIFTIIILLPVIAPKGSHSLWVLITHIQGETPFPAFSGIFMLDDIIVGYYNSETKICVVRGNTTSEDDVADPDHLNTISDNVLTHITMRSKYLRLDNHTETHAVFQIMSNCEQDYNETPGQMITKTAFRGSALDELRYFDGDFTYQSSSNYTAMEIKPYVELSMWHVEMLYYPACIKIMNNYFKKRGTQVNRKVKPQVRLIQKASSDSGGSRVICLATGFYPCHINLTLLRDGQPVADHEITGGDLLPNGDGTYQTRKSLEIRTADKHKYTCSATHLSLDNKLDVTLEFDPDEPFISVIPSVLIVLSLALAFGIVAVIYKCSKRQAASSKSDYSASSTSEEKHATSHQLIYRRPPPNTQACRPPLNTQAHQLPPSLQARRPPPNTQACRPPLNTQAHQLPPSLQARRPLPNAQVRRSVQQVSAKMAALTSPLNP